MKRKIVLLGAGSRYFETVLAELALTPELAGCSVMLYDVDTKGMRLMKQAGRRIFDKVGARLTLSSTTDLARALDGADFAISSIGVHGPDYAWHRLDSEVCARFGIIHTTGDTAGPSGLSQALRIIPIYMKIARAMRKYCPRAILLNHSNPMAPICRAIIKYAGINVVGYCHNIPFDIEWYGKLLGVGPEELEVTAAGPNHMTWLVSIRHRGRDVYPELKRRIAGMKPAPGRMFGAEVLRLLDIMPMGDDRHIVEFFPHARMATQPEELRYAMQWRVEMLDDMLRARGEADGLESRAAGKQQPLIPESASPESMGKQIRAMALGVEHLQYVNTANGGAVPNLPEWSVLDLRCVIGSHGAQPLAVGELPPQAARWSLAHIYAHELVVDAAVEGSRKKALQALACDSMMLNFAEVEEVFDAIVGAQGSRLARFRKRRQRRGPP